MDTQESPGRHGAHHSRRCGTGSVVRPCWPWSTPRVQATLAVRGGRIVLGGRFESTPAFPGRPLEPQRARDGAVAARGVGSRYPRTAAVADRPEATFRVRVPRPIAENALAVGGNGAHAGRGSGLGTASGEDGLGHAGAGACAGRGSSTGSTTMGIDSPGSPTNESCASGVDRTSETPVSRARNAPGGQMTTPVGDRYARRTRRRRRGRDRRRPIPRTSVGRAPRRARPAARGPTIILKVPIGTR
jgi:hypothetical protein